MSKRKLAPSKPPAPKAVEIPMSPLWHMGKVGLAGGTVRKGIIADYVCSESKASLKILQDAIDYLTKKARSKTAFTDSEKEFLVEIYEALWWGGSYEGFPEAAQLANHYVNGAGEEIEVDPEVYSTSVIVQDVQTVMKRVIAAGMPQSKGAFALKSTDARLLKRKDWLALFGPKGRKAGEKGYLVDNGILLAEQDNKRLKNTDNRFALQSVSQGDVVTGITTTWRVRSYYDFEPFAKATHVTHIPLGAGVVLQLPDGLSHYMTVLGIAKEFWYYAEWREGWMPATG